MARDVDKFSKKFAENVIQLRKEHGLSHEKLAALSQVSRATISNIEACRKSPTLGTCYKIAKSLGIKLSDLIKSSEL